MSDRRRLEMEEIIRRGYSVAVRNRADGPITRVEDLPSEADFALKSGDPAALSAARSALRARREAIQEELDELERDTGRERGPLVSH